MTKDFYQCRIQERSYLYGSIVSKALDGFNFKVLTSTVQRSMSGVHCPGFRVQRPGSNVQSPASTVQRPQSSVHSPASRVHRPESSIQSPASNSCVQSPGIPVCRDRATSYVIV